MESLDLARGLGHGFDVEFALMTWCHLGQQRIDEGAVIGQPILIGPPQGREPRVEILGHLGHRVDDDVVELTSGEDSAQTRKQCHLGGSIRLADELLDRRIAQIDVDDLASRVDAGVGAPGDDGGHLGAGDPFQPGFDGGLHRAQARLFGPAVEIRAAVAQVEAEAGHGVILAEAGPATPWSPSSSIASVNGSRALKTLPKKRENGRIRCW